MVNIIDNLTLDNAKPATHIIKKTDCLTYIAIGLLQNQVLKEHKTSFPALLTVLSGKITFRTENEELILNTFDTYEIPENVLHEVKGLDEKNIFSLMIEKE